MAPSDATITPNNIWQVEAKLLVVMEPLEAVELLGVVVQRHALVRGVHCPHLTQLCNSSMNCGKIIKGLELKNYKVCRIFYINSMKAYKRPMNRCIG